MATILVVDDEIDTVKLLSKILAKKGYDTLEAGEGREAVEIAKKEKPDAIILDIMMPEMDGFEAATILKEDSNTRDIPIIFLSVKSSEDDMVKGLDIADDYLTKPFNKNVLLSKVQGILKSKEETDKIKEEHEELLERFESLEEKHKKLLNEFSTLEKPVKGELESKEILDVSGIVENSALIEFSPSEKYEDLIVGMILGFVNEGKNVIVVTSPPRTKLFFDKIKSQVKDLKVIKFINLVSVRREFTKPEEGIYEVPIGSLEYFEGIWENTPENSIFFFMPISNLLLSRGLKDTYQFVNHMVEILLNKNVDLMAMINKDGHDLKEITSFENLFIHLLKIEDGQIRTIK